MTAHHSHVTERRFAQAGTLSWVVLSRPGRGDSARARSVTAARRPSREPRGGGAPRARAIAGKATPISDPLQRITRSRAAGAAIESSRAVAGGERPHRGDGRGCVGTARVWRWLRAPLGRGIAARAIETREVQVGSYAAGAADTAVGASHLGVVVPVIVQGGVFGVLTTADESRRFTERHIALLRAFADQCAIAIDKAGVRWSRGGRLDS